MFKTDLIGHYLKDFIHHKDYEELARNIRNADKYTNENEERNLSRDDEFKNGHKACNIVLRMKSIISPRGRNLNIKSALFKVGSV